MAKPDTGDSISPHDQRQPSMLQPRRTPARRSVSLRHSPVKAATKCSSKMRQSNSNSGFINGGTGNDTILASNCEGSPPSLQLIHDWSSSGVSSNAENWFECSNHESHKQTTSFADDGSPFFIRDASTSGPPPKPQQKQLQRDAARDDYRHLPLPTDLDQSGNDSSTIKDFRSIIDDLTIDNKRLRRRLKKGKPYVSNNTFNNGELFEIRVHSLKMEEKRELEEILYSFAGNLSSREAHGCPGSGNEDIRSNINHHGMASSPISPHICDSAYASISTSGRDSVPSGSSNDHAHTDHTDKLRQQRFQRHDHMSENMHRSRTPTTMTECRKKKLVVRRLEQLFTGRRALAGPHYQSSEQEDTSPAAATSGIRNEVTNTRAPREAPMMNKETEYTLGSGTYEQPNDSSGGVIKRQKYGCVAEQAFASKCPSISSKEQRPTCPLDLDPDRAQVPADNIRYIRRLGFSPQDPNKSPVEGRGWIDLNLLVSMAQLHTFNVTNGFVQQALLELSDNFEMANDGQKVRWKGNTRLESRSRESDDTSLERDDDNTDGQSPQKKLKITRGNGSRNSLQQDSHRKGAMSPRSFQQDRSKLTYEPIFYRQATESGEDCSSDGEEEDGRVLPLMKPFSAESTWMTCSGVRTAFATEKKKLDASLVLFYRDGCFCSDLTGDPVIQECSGAPLYRPSSVQPLGKQTSDCDCPQQTFEKRGPLEEAKELPEPMDLVDNPIPETQELGFPLPSLLEFSDEVLKPCNIEMEVTGIGGIYPADNFAIHVRTRHVSIEQAGTPTAPIQDSTKSLRHRIIENLRAINSQHRVLKVVEKRIISLERIGYPPSALPPPNCLILSDEESTSEDASETS